MVDLGTVGQAAFIMGDDSCERQDSEGGLHAFPITTCPRDHVEHDQHEKQLDMNLAQISEIVVSPSVTSLQAFFINRVSRH